ncbi:hypothetical protein AAG570_010550 [Ranatra chinensis]|uniref:EndoU domain-containing protein n=1 Tax=Ranatra chinensis TaxID=642074 RepID=A0ABD0Z4Y9_9HEMI
MHCSDFKSGQKILQAHSRKKDSRHNCRSSEEARPVAEGPPGHPAESWTLQAVWRLRDLVSEDGLFGVFDFGQFVYGEKFFSFRTLLHPLLIGNFDGRVSDGVQRFTDGHTSGGRDPLVFLRWSRRSDGPDIAEFGEDILDMDTNNVSNLVNVDLQEKSTGENSSPQRRPLLRLSSEVDRVATVRLLKELFRSEGNDPSARKRFIDAVVATRVMSHAIDYLRRAGKISGDTTEFKSILDRLWFTGYDRGGRRSSGFKHVFMAEPGPRSIVNGFHNWVHFAVEQDQNNIEYLGWMNRRIFRNNKGSVLALRFRWKKMLKNLSTMFLGTSPELEMAVYTVCFLWSGGGDCEVPFERGNSNITIRTIAMSVGDDDVIIIPWNMAKYSILEYLQTTQNPFVWNLDSFKLDYKHRDTTDWLQIKEGVISNDYHRFCVDLTLSYQLARRSCYNNAKLQLSKSKEILLKSENRLLKLYQPALKHIFYSTEAYITQLSEDSAQTLEYEEAQKYLKESLDRSCLPAAFWLIAVEIILDPQYSPESLFKRLSVLPIWLDIKKPVNVLELFANDTQYLLQHKKKFYLPTELEILEGVYTSLKQIVPEIVASKEKPTFSMHTQILDTGIPQPHNSRRHRATETVETIRNDWRNSDVDKIHTDDATVDSKQILNGASVSASNSWRRRDTETVEMGRKSKWLNSGEDKMHRDSVTANYEQILNGGNVDPQQFETQTTGSWRRPPFSSRPRCWGRRPIPSHPLRHNSTDHGNGSASNENCARKSRKKISLDELIDIVGKLK